MPAEKQSAPQSGANVTSAFLRFRTENFRSLRDEVELSAVATNLADSTEAVIQLPGSLPSALPVLAIYGANASGKSNVLFAMQYMCTAVRASQRSWNPEGGVPREPFLLDSESVNRPSLFEMEMVVKGVRYTYGFVVDSLRVLEEWIYAYPKGRKQEWLVRDYEAFKFGRDLAGENAAIQRLTRPNSLFLSTAAQNNHETLGPLFGWFASAVRFVSTDERRALLQRTSSFLEKERYEHGILQLLKLADLGVAGVEVSREEWSGEIKQMIERIAGNDSGLLRRLRADPFVKHLALRHTVSSGDNVLLPFEMESAGTRALLALAAPVLGALYEGGLLMVDEIDSSLHPLLALELVRLFQNAQTNPHRAQLVFNTHDTHLLDADVLRRDQIWFAEKDPAGVSKIYPLTDYHPRRDENVKRGYFQGRYGAVPFLTGAQSIAEMARIHGEST